VGATEAGGGAPVGTRLAKGEAAAATPLLGEAAADLGRSDMVQTLQPAKRAPLGDAERFELPEGLPSFGFPFMRLFDDPWRPFSEDRWSSPPLDILENDLGYTVAIELPGMKKDDVRIQIENGVFTVSGERKLETVWKEGNVHRSERRYGTFCRTITLPSGVDPAAAKAEMRDGVLFVTFPKSEEAKPRFLKIS
jgi:HSP20 family protein